MKVLLLAGGYGTRLSEETEIKPKPMVEIGGKPILWHIMKIYSQYGFNDFVILLGYKGYQIKEYFMNYFIHQSDVTIDIKTGKMKIHNNLSEPWKVTLIDTGLDTMTGGRIKRAQNVIGNGRFMLTYGDGVADININKLIEFHKSHGKAMTMTSAQPEGRFGALKIENGNEVTNFLEKPIGDGNNWVNAGFFVCEPKVFDYITEGDGTVFEQTPLQNLAEDGEIYTYKHKGFWMPMDTLRDKLSLQKLWETGKAPWRVW
ncbi:glucose-1-phosphate cytidylyltransferase [Methanosarcina sp.]|uniref:glucose-1-phosphate cytidylyltransferase n=1 Tax=Methanosarcina sp. TaxID=2213 RepID=UPI002988FA78|nr:glucose-1-phosphate cytidylyltransferase [Methanosarcina sp.]MDW5549196.1 glucose-1-phosphate cytidylyltransferase [Methanosarcina sp.]MDW5553098.1 glucose-1-phosphate cytidylyltransferase [Methanosarcina sp.]MDW5559376.1 glucose-1-phosphate cytidylyltransferase [Methanosarcina sp.]